MNLLGPCFPSPQGSHAGEGAGVQSEECGHRQVRGRRGLACLGLSLQSCWLAPGQGDLQAGSRPGRCRGSGAWLGGLWDAAGREGCQPRSALGALPQAQAVTLTVAQAFQVALDLWEAAHAGSRQEQPLRPSCALESSEPGSTRAPAPMGNTPLQHLGEEEEEDDDLDEAFPRLDTASAGSRDLVCHTAGNELAPPGAPPRRQGQAGGGCQSPCTRAILPCGALGLTRPRQASAPPSRTKCSHPPCA
ncbi:uncharacterized protein LOC112548464 isoform X2 [Alligator sinensis]|uniref:Uncharacterized protein LOC112548464 isoform X2 n=1 Tax=Alligator sinensis TaxID=38654 RepID=A0A3Q0FVC8_ALLSI|nr:uncharacterized protein LOC112548464 isoform X2 [Alligator sinensis]